jgi:rhomboid protease GluP
MSNVVFNLLWIRSLVPQVATAFGACRLVILYTVTIVVGGLFTSLAGYLLQGIPILEGSKFAIGASGGLFGLLGALLAYGQIQKDFTTRQDAWVLAIGLFVFGVLTPMLITGDIWVVF